MTMMTAIEITSLGEPEVLKAVQRAIPVAGEGEVLVRIRAAGVNRVDVFQRRGLYAPPPGTTDIPGVEFSGEVAAIGAGVTRYRAGDRVCGIVIGGGYAEYCNVPEGQLLPMPAGYDFVTAAGVCETFATVWAAIYGQGRLSPGESLLVHGGSSGIGTTAIMLARALGAGKIFATAGSAEKCAACLGIGATHAINYNTEDFVDVVKRETDGHGVDVVLDMVAGSYVPRNISLLADDGRLVFVGRMSQDLEFKVHVQQIMYARLSITGVSLRGQSPARKTKIMNSLETVVWPLLEAKQMAPIIDSVFPLQGAADAHRKLESSQHIGKIVLTTG
jgi:putative PIG3 family NAD(P)H quinone oxidoreductase